MIYGSVCSGIEAASVAWHPLGWRAAFLSDIDPFAQAVLSHRQAGAPVHGDFTTIKRGDYDPIDLLVGGTPCQSFSIAGLRKGMDDDRGNLALGFIKLAQSLRPRWIVWENVPGVLQSNGGKDFGTFLGALGDLGYGFAYRVLDAQNFGVPQRRRRVFVVGYLGDWRRPAAVLFERHSLSGHLAPRRKEKCKAPRVAVRSLGEHSVYECHGQDSRVKELPDVCSTVTAKYGTGGNNVPIVSYVPEVANTLTQRMYKGFNSLLDEGQTPVVYGFQSSANVGDIESAGEDISPTVRVGSSNTASPPAVAYGIRNGHTAANGIGIQEERTHTLEATGTAHAIASGAKIRRLTPIECERLQGFPDDYTKVPFRGKPADQCPISRRYAAIGNSMAVPVMSWIGGRIEMLENSPS